MSDPEPGRRSHSAANSKMLFQISGGVRSIALIFMNVEFLMFTPIRYKANVYQGTIPKNCRTYGEERNRWEWEVPLAPSHSLSVYPLRKRVDYEQLI